MDIQHLNELTRMNPEHLKAVIGFNSWEIKNALRAGNLVASIQIPDVTEALRTSMDGMFQVQQSGIFEALKALPDIRAASFFAEDQLSHLQQLAGVTTQSAISEATRVLNDQVIGSALKAMPPIPDITASLFESVNGLAALQTKKLAGPLADWPVFQIPEIYLPKYDFAHMFQEQFSRTFENIGRWTRRGTRVGDILILGDENEPEAERYAAAERLALSTFTLRYLFAPERRYRIQTALVACCEDRRRRDVWIELVTPVLFAEIPAFSGETPLAEMFKALRRSLRRSIEVELLGHTLDSQAAGQVDLDAAYAVSDPDDPFERIHLTLDATRLLQHLPDEAARLVMSYFADPDGREALASNLGIKPEALRQRVSRATRKLQLLATV